MIKNIKFYISITFVIVTGNVIGQELDRSTLPIKEPIRQTYKELDV